MHLHALAPLRQQRTSLAHYRPTHGQKKPPNKPGAVIPACFPQSSSWSRKATSERTTARPSLILLLSASQPLLPKADPVLALVLEQPETSEPPDPPRQLLEINLIPELWQQLLLLIHTSSWSLFLPLEQGRQALGHPSSPNECFPLLPSLIPTLEASQLLCPQH